MERKEAGVQMADALKCTWAAVMRNLSVEPEILLRLRFKRRASLLEGKLRRIKCVFRVHRITRRTSLCVHWEFRMWKKAKASFLGLSVLGECRF